MLGGLCGPSWLRAARDGGGSEDPVLCGVSRAAANEPAMMALVMLLSPKLLMEALCGRGVPRVGEIGALI